MSFSSKLVQPYFVATISLFSPVFVTREAMETKMTITSNIKGSTTVERAHIQVKHHVCLEMKEALILLADLSNNVTSEATSLNRRQSN